MPIFTEATAHHHDGVSCWRVCGTSDEFYKMIKKQAREVERNPAALEQRIKQLEDKLDSHIEFHPIGAHDHMSLMRF